MSTQTTPTYSSRQAVLLIARREITVRLRSRAFRIATLISVVILVGVALIAKLVGGHGPSYQEVGLTPATMALGPSITATAAAANVNLHLHDIDEATGRQQVKDGTLDALVVSDGATMDVVVKTDIDGGLQSVLSLVAARSVLDEQVQALGGDPAKVAAAISAAQVTVSPLVPPSPKRGQQLAIGILASILIYVSLLMSGQAVAQGVVEEKTSRIVEILLASVRPWQLMAGKVAGIGIVGLIQVAVTASAGIFAGLATKTLTLHASAAIGLVVWLVVWFLLGFAAYAVAFAGAAALVSRQEDVASTITPVMMFLIIGYVIGVSVLPSNPTSSFVGTLSLIPLFAPTLMPVRLALGVVPVWQAIVSVAAVALLIPLLVWLAGRIYRNAVLRSGARVRLRDAWRAA
jgi:ABC-2 type transport system permease protein